VGGSGEHRELGVRQELEHLHHVRQRHEVPVAEQQQGRRLKRAQLVGPPRERLHRGPRLGLELEEARGVGSDRAIGVLHLLEVGLRRQAVLAERRVLPAGRAVGVRGGGDQLADPGGRGERDGARDQAAEAEPVEVSIRDPQVVK
jgi:hypothetical protein